MTTLNFSNTLISIVADVSRDLSDEVRYKRLLTAMQGIFPCDATALLKLEGNTLCPLAVDGLSSDTMGRRVPGELVFQAATGSSNSPRQWDCH